MAGRLSILSDLLTGAMGQSPARVRAFLGSLDEATAARLMAAAEAGDNRTILKAMADQTWGTAPARPVPPPVPPAASRDPVSFRDRIASDPKVRAGLEDAGISTAGMTDPQALKEYVRTVRGSAEPVGRPRSSEDSIRELAAAQQTAVDKIAEQFDRAAGLVPYGVRGPGVPVGGPSGPGLAMGPSTALVPSQPRALSVVDAAAPDALESSARELTVVDASPRVTFDENQSRIPGPLDEEDVFAPAASSRPRIGYAGPQGPGVPVGGVARERPTGLMVPRRGPEVPGWVPYAATAGVVGGLGAAAYYGTRPGEAQPAATNVDAALDAAATAVAPDEEVKSAAPAGSATDPSDLNRKLPGETMAQYQARVAREMGADTAEALRSAEERARPRNAAYRDALRRQADAEVRGGDPSVGYGAATFTLPDGSEGVMVNGRAVPAHLDATGRPLGGGRYYTLGAENRVIDAEREAMRAAGGDHGVPGPRTDDGRNPTPAPQFRTAGEAERYYTRPRDPQTGKLLPSPADAAMAQRAFVPTFDDSGEAHYQMGFPISTGAGPEVRRQLQHYTNHLVPGTNAPAWETESRAGPTGTVEAMVPTKANREYNANVRQRASLIRLAARGSKKAEEALQAGMTPQEEMRLMNERDELARRAKFARRAGLVGGSQNLNNVTRSRTATLDEMGNPSLNDWQRMALAETMLRHPQEMTPLGVQAVGGANALNMLRGMNLGQGMLGNPLLQNAQIDAATLQNQQARAAQQTEILKWADQHVSDNYAEPHGILNWISRTIGSPHDVTEFTVAEQDKALQALMARYPHLTLAQAQQIIDSVGSNRTTRPRPVAAGS